MTVYRKVRRVKDKNGGIHLDSKNRRNSVMSERSCHTSGKTKSGKVRNFKGVGQRRGPRNV